MTLLWGTGQVGAVSEMDMVLAEALHEYESGLCKNCGQPLAMTTSTMTHPLDFGLDSVVCAGCELLKSDAANDPAPGELIFITNQYGTH